MNKFRLNKKVTIVLPIIFLLGTIFYFIVPRGILLRADDSVDTLVKVYQDNKDITDGSFQTEKSSVIVGVESDETQLLAFHETDKLSVSTIQDEIVSREVSENDFDVTQLMDQIEKESEEIEQSGKSNSKTNNETQKSELIKVFNAKGELDGTYLKLIGKTKVSLKIENKTKEEANVRISSFKDNSSKQNLFQFIQSNETETKGDDKLPTLEELENKEFTEKDSFKAFKFKGSLPRIKEKSATSKTKTKSERPAVELTGAHISLSTGTSGFDEKTSPKDPADPKPGEDQSSLNDWVRSFDSTAYKVAFSMESSDPLVNYTDIKYRVEMSLPKAYTISDDGEERFNAAVMAGPADYGGLKEETAKTQTSTASKEQVLEDPGNSNIIVPMIVNVFGAKHRHELNPTVKLTIVSAKNEATGEIVEINQEYSSEDTENLAIKRTVKVSAKPSIQPNLIMGGRTALGNFVQGMGGYRKDWEAFGLGLTLSLKPIPGTDRGKNEKDDFRGSTFPSGEITYKVESKSRYTEAIGKEIDWKWSDVPLGNGGTAAYAVAHAPATASTNADDWTADKHLAPTHPERYYKFTDDLIQTSIPKGVSKSLYIEEPKVSIEEKKEIGVFDTGNITVTDGGHNIQVSVKNFAPLYNPYTYSLAGTKISANDKVFSSISMIAEWNKEYLTKKGKGILETVLSINSIDYDAGNGMQTHNLTEIPNQKIASGTVPYGAYSTGVGFTKGGTIALDSGGSNHKSVMGDGTVRQNEKNIYVGNIFHANPDLAVKSIAYLTWNANSFEYDKSRDIELQSSWRGVIEETSFGVGKSKNHPTLTLPSQKTLDNEYEWYSSVEEAQKKGKISAVRVTTKRTIATGIYNCFIRAPIKIIGIPGSKDKEGNSNVARMQSYSYDSTGKQLNHSPSQTYTPSVFDQDGKKTGGHNDKGYSGDTLFIKPFGIETTTKPTKDIYKTTETSEWKVTGEILSDADKEYGVRLTTTVPKGLNYVLDSAVDNNGEKIVPKVEKNSDGTTKLVFELRKRNPSKAELAEVKFETTSELKNLEFNSELIAEQKVTTVGEIWLEDDDTQTDTSREELRSSSGKIQLYQLQQIVLKKSVDKEFIEVGKIDDADSKLSNDVTYTIDLTNNSSEKLLDVRLLDVLPYVGDSIGSKFDGDYTVKNIEVVKGEAKVHYLNKISNGFENTNPKVIDLSSWSSFDPEKDELSEIEKAKAFLLVKNEMEIGDKLSVKITISPKGQKVANLYRNRASMNNSLDLPIKSNVVETTVYGRDLTGYVWYDDNYDGLMDQDSNGKPTDPVKDIAVKLYRTSLENGTYKKELVKQSLTGDEFIDSSGNSKIKTGTDGKYIFKNLPEGDYLAEFVLGDIVVTNKFAIVTKQLVGTDPKLNSKSDPDNFKTPEYNHPVLKDLPTLLTGTDKVHHITDVNAGLARLSRIQLFKYEEGTVIDQNGDGKLSDKEIEDKSTHALEGAEFDLYKGKSDKPDEKDKIASGKTGSDGWLVFKGSDSKEITLPPGDYTIVETKAPDGFELLKDPIYVNVPTYNYVAVVHVADKGQTELPFTGGTKAMRIILIGAATLLVIGMTGVFLHFRPIKVRGGN